MSVRGVEPELAVRLSDAVELFGRFLELFGVSLGGVLELAPGPPLLLELLLQVEVLGRQSLTNSGELDDLLLQGCDLPLLVIDLVAEPLFPVLRSLSLRRARPGSKLGNKNRSE